MALVNQQITLPSGNVITLVSSVSFNKNNFFGQKLLHPYKLVQTAHGSYKMKYDEHNISDENAETLKNTTRFDVKHDGACGMIVWNGSEYVAYSRLDVKKNKQGEFISPGPDTIPCEPMPTDLSATHWPHFVPVTRDVKQYKWYISAFENSKTNIQKLDPSVCEQYTCEFMGPHFNQKSCDTMNDKQDHIVLHGTLQLIIPQELRTFEGFCEIMQTCPIEGIVAYPDGKQPIKIRGELFEIEWTNWKNDNPIEQGWSNYVVM